MGESPDRPSVIRSVCGSPNLEIDSSIAQVSSPATSFTPEHRHSSPESPRDSVEVHLWEFKHTGTKSPTKSLQKSQDHSRERLLPAMSQNRPQTERLVVMRRKIIRKMPSPIRTALVSFRRRPSTKIRQMISEPFDAVKVVDGEPEHLHRHHQLMISPRKSSLPLSLNPISISELSAVNDRFPAAKLLSSPGPRPKRTQSHPVVVQEPSELEATAQRPTSAAPVLCLQKSLPPCLTIMIPELTITTVDGKAIDPSTQPKLSIRPPPKSNQATQATLNETYAWKNQAENERKSNVILNRRVQQLEEEMQRLHAAATLQKVSADHFKMLFEKESNQVEKLEKELERAVKRAVAAEAEAGAGASKVSSAKRSSSQRTSESTKSWSHSDEAKFHAVKLSISSPPPSPTISMTPSLSSSISVSTTESDDRKGWVTAEEILGGSRSDDQFDPEVTENSQSEPPTLFELPAELESEHKSSPEIPIMDVKLPTELPTERTPLTHSTFTSRTSSTAPVHRISFTHHVNTRIGYRPAVFRIPVSPTPNTPVQGTSCDWCPSLDTWEWSSVPDVKLRDFVAEKKKRNRVCGRVFEGRELVSFKLGL